MIITIFYITDRKQRVLGKFKHRQLDSQFSTKVHSGRGSMGI